MKVSKKSVNYRSAKGAAKQCRSCSMFRPKLSGATGTCTLVAGEIRAGDVCDRWTAKGRQ